MLCDKPLISEETDLLEPSLLDELLCHLSSLASVYHKPPSSFVEVRVPGRRAIPNPLAENYDDDQEGSVEASEGVIPSSAGNGIDLLGIDSALPSVLTTGAVAPALAPAPPAPAAVDTSLLPADLLGGPVRSLVGSGVSFARPKEIWLPGGKGKGLEIAGTFSRRAGLVSMDLTFANRSLQTMGDFAIQFNKNSFGLAPVSALVVPSLSPNGTFDVSMACNTRKCTVILVIITLL